MEEAKRFLRYVLPGLVSLLQLIFILYLNNDLEILEKSTLGTAASAFFASGVLGFLFSNFYYVLHWKLYYKCPCITKLNYKKIIYKYPKLFKYFDYSEHLKQREAWTILNALANFSKIPGIREAEKTMQSVSNILVSIGTTILILFFSCLTCLFIYWKYLEICDIVWFILVNVITLVILLFNYQIVAGTLQSLHERTFEWLSKHIK